MRGVYLTAMDRVWARMKGAAAAYASEGKQITEGDARRLVLQYLRESGISPWPPADAIAFLVAEMLQMAEPPERASVA